MAEAVEFLWGKLLQMQSDQVLEESTELTKLVDTLNDSKASQKNSSWWKQEKLRNDERYQELLLKVRDTVYEIDDIINDYVEAQATTNKPLNLLLKVKAFATKPASTLSLGQHTDSLRDMIEGYKDDFSRGSSSSISDGVQDRKSPLQPLNFMHKVKAFATKPAKTLSLGKHADSLRDMINGYTDHFSLGSSNSDNVQDRKSPLQFPPIKDSPVVGFENEKKEIIGYLRENSEELDAISLVGMPGIGKTALALKIFKCEEVMFEFPTRVWVNVSGEFSEKEAFLSILKHFPSLTDNDIKGREISELAQLVANNLEGNKFLIVIDDVVAAHDLKKLRLALPKDNKMSKVLITSRNEHVVRGWHANASRCRPAIKLRLLTQSESWSLLQSEVFGDGECPSELESIGRLIADKCDGLPLAICAIADAISKVDLASTDTGGRRSGWTRVCSRVPQYISNVFFLALPEHLRPCFLYLGMFPQDFEIRVSKLTRMWIAEGFIKKEDDRNFEETAESYLDDLVNRNLVIAAKVKRNGKPKTCRLHLVLHEHCRSENQRENFIKQIDSFSDGAFNPPASDLSKYRRLCIHSNFSGFLHSKPSGPRARSLISFAYEKVPMTPENSTVIPAGFKRVRVLDVPILFTKIPSDMYHLFHLRYLVLYFDSTILPASLSRLWNIQTLILNTKSHTLEIKADISQFTQLRHLKTSVSTTLTTTGKPTGSGKQGQNLQTLETVSPESCTSELFSRARDLKKLGIRGKLASFFDGKIGSFDRLAELSYLQTLMLRNDVFPSPASDGLRNGLPESSRFPPNLRSLTLANTWLDWKHMHTLALLKRLEKLKLKANAFIGNSWSTEDGGFDSLEVLHIGRTDLVIWVVSTDHFPNLKSIKLKNCKKLREVPIQLACIPRLQRLELLHTELAAPSANRIRDEIQKSKSEIGTINNGREFKLSISPSID